MVRYETHRRASRTKGAAKACVGHASRHRVQLPQRSVIGSPGSSSSVVTTSPSSTIEPTPGAMSMPFFPTNPSPARAAHARSSTGSSSQSIRAFARGGRSSPESSVRMNFARRHRRRRMKRW